LAPTASSGCTEIGLLIGPAHLALPTFDATAFYTDEAVQFSLGAGASKMPNAMKGAYDHLPV